MREPRTVRAATLASDPDTIAPVSGLRCRVCGANARWRPADQLWVIWNRTAYCPECLAEHRPAKLDDVR